MPINIQRTGNAQTDRVLQDLGLIVSALWDAPLSQPVVLENVSLGVADTTLAHGLGQPPKGYIVVRKNALSDVAELTKSSEPDKFIILRASAPVVVDVVVF